MAPVHSPLVRAELDTSKHSAVDAFLKSLKQHTRTLSALYSQHTTELAVLERIYYINNNQHRAALFWKRVVEARRYALRLKSLGVLAHVNALRAAFYGSPVDTSSKPSKGAWTHYPQARFLRAFLAHLHTCVTLLDEVRIYAPHPAAVFLPPTRMQTSTRALAVYGFVLPMIFYCLRMPECKSHIEYSLSRCKTVPSCTLCSRWQRSSRA
ncbi:hypothetical protein BC834DRAFT_816340 [Gloeopeniophorella convolvens]|nr:hypothetical protein BC834DRAFT_816340 [Gloeopeniophorella convolvens]